MPIGCLVTTCLPLSVSGATGRSSWPRTGRRLDRRGAGRIVCCIARRAGSAKPVGPHALQHTFITAVLDAGVSRCGRYRKPLHTPLEIPG